MKNNSLKIENDKSHGNKSVRCVVDARSNECKTQLDGRTEPPPTFQILFTHVVAVKNKLLIRNAPSKLLDVVPA